MKEKKTVLIMGISSFVGSSLAESLKQDYRVIGTYHSNPVSIPGVLTLPCDVLKREVIQMVIFTFKPDVTIYCVGLASIEDCNESDKTADVLNSHGVFNVVAFTERYKSRLIYISSGYIFSGENKLQVESDTPAPNTIYGRTKASAEFFIQKSCLNYLIFRCSYLYGRSISPFQKTFFEILEDSTASGKQQIYDTHIYNGYIDTHYLAFIIKICLEYDIQNRLFQVSSKDVMSHYEFGIEYCNVFERNKGLISKGRWSFPEVDSMMVEYSDAEGIFYRLDTKNIESYLNIELPSIKESLEGTLARLSGDVVKKKRRKKDGQIQFI